MQSVGEVNTWRQRQSEFSATLMVRYSPGARWVGLASIVE